MFKYQLDYYYGLIFMAYLPLCQNYPQWLWPFRGVDRIGYAVTQRD